MAQRFSVIWFDASNGERRGSAADLDAAVHLLRTMGPHDWVRGVVKLGNKVMHRQARAA